jgi:cation transport regulator ChaC
MSDKIFLFVGLILGLLTYFAIRWMHNQRTKPALPPETKQDLDMTPADVSVEGIIFQNIPESLSETLQKLEKRESVGYDRISQMQSLSDLSKDNLEILLALSWMQAAIVESGVFIDDLESDYQIGRAFFETYEKEVGEDTSASYLPVSDKLDRLHRKLDSWKANPL